MVYILTFFFLPLLYIKSTHASFTHRQRVSIEKHFGTVNAIRAIPNFIGCSALPGGDAASFLSAGRDSVINLWTNGGDCVGTQTAHRGSVTVLSDINMNLKFRHGVPLLFSLGVDSSIKLWDLRKFKQVTEFDVPDSNVTKAVWAGQHIVSSSSSGHVRLWSYFQNDRTNLADSNSSSSFDMLGNGGKEKESLTWDYMDLAGHSQASTDLISTGQFVASGSKDGNINRWFTSS